MYTYRITNSARPDNMEMVMETESLGWELVHIVPDGNRFVYWFRKPISHIVNWKHKTADRVQMAN